MPLSRNVTHRPVVPGFFYQNVKTHCRKRHQFLPEGVVVAILQADICLRRAFDSGSMHTRAATPVRTFFGVVILQRDNGLK